MKPHKTCMAVRQTFENKLQNVSFNTKWYSIKKGYIFSDHTIETIYISLLIKDYYNQDRNNLHFAAYNAVRSKASADSASCIVNPLPRSVVVILVVFANGVIRWQLVHKLIWNARVWFTALSLRTQNFNITLSVWLWRHAKFVTHEGIFICSLLVDKMWNSKQRKRSFSRLN